MSKLLESMYEEAEREEINDKLKEFVGTLTNEEKERLKKIVNNEPDIDEPDTDEPDIDEADIDEPDIDEPEN